MGKVQLTPLWSVAGGGMALVAVATVSHLSPLGWMAGWAYLLVSNALLARGLRRSGMAHFGPANAATLVRSTLVGLVTAIVATSFTAPISVPLLIALAIPALALDAIDGWIARRTDTVSELGARFDMEVDAYLLLALSVYVAQGLGWWVVAIGALRYLFVVAGWALPWMQATLPPRYWRKVVTAVAGIALTVAASALFPGWASYAVVGIGLALLLESFARDVTWLVLHRRQEGSAPADDALTPASAERDDRRPLDARPDLDTGA